MKILTITILLSLTISLKAQDKVVGRYHDYFGNQVQLNADSTFKYTWSGHYASSWTKGLWTLKNDTVCFHMIPIYDTTSMVDDTNLTVDTFVLSKNEIPERVELLEYLIKNISPNGQNKIAYPDKLFFKKGKLYKIQKGKIIMKKQKGLMWTKAKYDPWYFKDDD